MRSQEVPRQVLTGSVLCSWMAAAGSLPDPDEIEESSESWSARTKQTSSSSLQSECRDHWDREIRRLKSGVGSRPQVRWLQT
jgi:hypothetical protein